MRTLLRLAKALGCTVRIPDLAAAAADQGHTETTLAEKAQIAFDTVRSLLARPSSGNVRSLEKLCAALGSISSTRILSAKEPLQSRQHFSPGEQFAHSMQELRVDRTARLC